EEGAGVAAAAVSRDPPAAAAAASHGLPAAGVRGRLAAEEVIRGPRAEAELHDPLEEVGPRGHRAAGPRGPQEEAVLRGHRAVEPRDLRSCHRAGISPV